MNDFALMCQTIILSKHPLSEASVTIIIPTDMLSSFHKSKEVCESYNQNLTAGILPHADAASAPTSYVALSAGGHKSRRRHIHWRRRARKTRRGCTQKSKSKSKNHRRRRHSRVRKHKKNTSRR